jgi:hypothetical protein
VLTVFSVLFVLYKSIRSSACKLFVNNLFVFCVVKKSKQPCEDDAADENDESFIFDLNSSRVLAAKFSALSSFIYRRPLISTIRISLSIENDKNKC